MIHRIAPSLRLAPLVVLIALAVFVPRLRAQVTGRNNLGTEFYVAFFPNEGGEVFNETLNTDDLYLTSRVPAHGEVDIPALGFYQTFTTVPGQITTIILPNGNNGSATVLLPESDDEKVVHGMAVHVTSDTPIAVFGMNHKKWSSDAFMALPVNVLGTEYRTMNFTTSEAQGDGDTPGEFVIVAVQDSTNVTITLRDVTSRGTRPNVPFTIRMNKGDVYMVQGDPGNGSDDLTGTLIESDQPIAVLSGHKRTEIPENATNVDGSSSRDLLVEQLPPVSAWGDSALVVPFATSQKPDLVRVVCAEDGTQISVNGTPVPGTYNAGDFYQITQLSGVTSIQASKPIEVGQYMHTSWGDYYSQRPPLAYGDPALALVFPVEQFDTSYTILSIVDAEAFTGNFVNIVADASAINTMRLDGQPMNPAEFSPIPNTRFDYAQHQLAQGTHNISGSKPFGVTVYALGPVDSYAYVGGTSLKTITPLKTVALSIDFGDRLLTNADTTPPYPHTATDAFDTTVYLQNVSEDTVNIYGFPRRIQDTDRFHVIAPACSPSAPHVIKPGATDSMTIEFWPHEVNRRMHTQITASTDHLRAYVVDVYGRGVEDVLGVFRDTNKVTTIDTIDFGTFTNTDAPADSMVYIGNAGTVPLTVTGIQVTGDPKFTTTGTIFNGGPVPPNFSIPTPPSGSARVGVEFNPFGSGNGTFTAQLTVRSSSSTHIVVLIGHVETITALAPQVTAIQWGTTLVCNDSVYQIPITNPNNLSVVITSALVVGDGTQSSDAGSFAVSTQTPDTIAPGATGTVEVHFEPTGRGKKTADVILSYNLPKNTNPDTIPVLGTGDKLTLELGAPVGLHEYALDPSFLVPIYARTDLTPFAPDGYHIHVFYDSEYLKLIDIVTKGTLTPPGYPALFPSTPPGHDTVYFAQASSETHSTTIPIIGGGPAASPAPYGPPLVYLRFQPELNGADPYTFTKGFPIRFDVVFDDAAVPYQCADHIYDSGFVQVDPACDTQYLITQPQFPSAMMLGLPQPNPAQNQVTVPYDVAMPNQMNSQDAATPVTIDVTDMDGTVVRTLVNAPTQPGYYTARLDASGLPNGVYLLRMSANGYQSEKKLVIQR